MRRYLIGVSIITAIYCVVNAAVFDIVMAHLDSPQPPHPILSVAFVVFSFPMMYLGYFSGLVRDRGAFIACSMINGALWGLVLMWAGSKIATYGKAAAQHSDHASPPAGPVPGSN
jgi:hypothetical protein